MVKTSCLARRRATAHARAESAREAAAGISILRLLERVGLHDLIENVSTRSVGLSLRTSSGAPVSTPPAFADSQSTSFIALNSSRCAMMHKHRAPFVLVIVVHARINPVASKQRSNPGALQPTGIASTSKPAKVEHLYKT
jgi:hypothetical protein